MCLPVVSTVLSAMRSMCLYNESSLRGVHRLGVVCNSGVTKATESESEENAFPLWGVSDLGHAKNVKRSKANVMAGTAASASLASFLAVGHLTDRRSPAIVSVQKQ